jgi:Tfp pilus assembly protein PilV
VARTIRINRCRKRGITLVELLVAALLMSIGLMGMVQMWAFSYTMTSRTDDLSIAYNLGRQEMERVKMSGFTGAAEGTVDKYYDVNQVYLGSTPGTSRFHCSVSVVSSAVKSGSIGTAGAVPDDAALRTVTVTVRRTGSAGSLYTSSTYLVKGGV